MKNTISTAFKIFISVILLVVCIGFILYISTTVDFPYNNKYIEQSTKGKMKGISESIILYEKQRNHLPNNLKELIDQGYLNEGWDNDYWGNKFEYLPQKDGYEIRSHGPDKKRDTKYNIVMRFRRDGNTFKMEQ